MDDKSLTFEKAMIITRIEYLILNMNNDPNYISREIFHLIDEHKISEIKDTIVYFYEALLHRGYQEYAKEFAEKYNIETRHS